MQTTATPFWMEKSLPLETTFIDLGDTTLLFISLWTLCKISIAFGARKPKVSKIYGMKVCWLSEHAFSCLTTLLEATLRVVCLIVKPLVHSPTSGETPFNSTQACLPHTHPYTRISVGLIVDIPSCGSVNKFTDASFFIDTPVHQNISNMTSLTRSCQYLKPGMSL